MAKHIGIAAVSAEGAALCYRTICAEAKGVMGLHAHPEVSMHTYPLSEYMRFTETGRWKGAAQLLRRTAAKLAKVGAAFVICPDNTIHQVFDEVMRYSPLPWLHIAEEVAAEANRRNFKRLGVLGTRWLMEGPVYAEKLKARGIDFRVPEIRDRRRVHDFILKELVYHQLKEDTLGFFQGLIKNFQKQGCDGVVLGCTEIPLLINDRNSPLPTLNSTRLLALAALRMALGVSPLPRLYQTFGAAKMNGSKRGVKNVFQI